MKSLNIAFVADGVTHIISGATISSLRFAERLAARGHNVIFLAARKRGEGEVSYHEGLKIYRFPSIVLPGSKGKIAAAFPSPKRVKKILERERIDILHITDPTPSAFVCIRAARKLGLKVVAHCHLQPENWYSYLPAMFRSRRLDGPIYRLMVRLYRKMDAVIIPSRFGESQLRRYAPNLNIHVISNGVDLSVFRKAECHDFRERYGLSPEDRVLLYVGRLSPEKSPATLIEAMPFVVQEFRNTRLVITGEGPLRAGLERLAMRLGVDRSVTFLKRLTLGDLIQAYNACEMLILPSIVELEGMVVLEAMACGKPVLISDSDRSASNGFVRENGFVFRLQQAEDLAAKALILLRDDGLRRRMGAASTREAKAYDINGSVDKLEALYRELVK